MNPFEMVVLIVAIVMIASVIRSKHRYRSEEVGGLPPAERLESDRLRDEIRQLKERIQVLERITVEREDSLSRQIEELRDRP